MARKKSYMATSRGYSRAAHKAATMAVVDEDYYEELVAQESGAALFRVPDGERAEAAGQAPAPTDGRHHPPPQPQPRSGARQERRTPGLLGRIFGALRRLG